MAKIMIIGGGVAGISAGIYARLAGHEATVCERHFIAGGNLTAWDRGGYHIDNCIHWLTGTNPASKTYRTWRELGVLGDVEIMQGEALYTCEHEGRTLGLYSDLRRLEREMLEISPEDARETKALIRAVDLLQGACRIAGEKHNGRVNPKRLLLGVPPMLRYYGMTTGELAARFKHPLLASLMTAFWGEEFGALALIFVFAHYCGANGGIPRGSSSAMAERMVDRLRELGGELLLKKEAVKVNLDGGRAVSVSFADGETIAADYVVVTIDPAVAFGGLIDAPMPERLRKKYENPRMKRFSSYQCAFACDLPTPPFDGDFIFDAPVEFRDRLPMKQIILREFSHEPSFAPEGRSIIQTMTFCFEEDAVAFIDLKNADRAAYEARKREIAALITRAIEQKFPELTGRLTLLDVWTPATYHRFTASEMGSYMSFALPSRALPLRDRARVRGVRNLLLATQWQQIPGGLPIAAECGRRAVKSITRREKCPLTRTKRR